MIIQDLPDRLYRGVGCGCQITQTSADQTGLSRPRAARTATPGSGVAQRRRLPKGDCPKLPLR